jgi:hypothetical protein
VSELGVVMADLPDWAEDLLRDAAERCDQEAWDRDGPRALWALLEPDDRHRLGEELWSRLVDVLITRSPLAPDFVGPEARRLIEQAYGAW